VQSLPEHPQKQPEGCFFHGAGVVSEPPVSRCNRYQNKSALRLSFMDFSNKTI
jgi:hypothetical protein